jgi:hypothetical protein
MVGGLNIQNVTNKTIIDVFNGVRKLPKWHGRWITDADWCDLLRPSSLLLDTLTKAKLNQAIGRSTQTKHGFEAWASTPIGLLRRHNNVGGNNTWCYFASVPGYSVVYPVDGTPWSSEVKAIRWAPRHLRSAEETQYVIPAAAAVVSAAVTDDAGRAKRPRSTSPLQSVSRRLLEETCWDSTSARKIFASREDHPSEGVREVIEKRLALLSAAHFNATGYKSLVEGHDPDDLLSNHDVYVVRLKAQYLKTALDIALAVWMPGSVTWTNCCERAIAHKAKTGVEFCIRANTIIDWHKHIRIRNTMPHPYRFAGKEKVMNLP